MNRKDVFLKQMDACFDKNSWFVSLHNALDGVTEEQAIWKDGLSNSIWEIVSHLIFWNERYLIRFKGVLPDPMEGDNDTTFYNDANENWQSSMERIHTIFSSWRQALQESNEQKLDEIVRENSDQTWETALSNLIIHNAYHIGQIVHIRKQQKIWDRNQGVH